MGGYLHKRFIIIISFHFSAESGPSLEALSCESPEHVFRLLFPDVLVDSIVLHTNLYAMQKGFAITFTCKDVLTYIGLNIAMGIIDLPDITDYWASVSLVSFGYVAEQISSNPLFFTFCR